MRISKQTDNVSYRNMILPILGLIVVAASVWAADSFFSEPEISDVVYFCDAEQFQDGEFVSQGIVFLSNCFQDKKEYVHGKASCRCEGDRIYGPGLNLYDLNPGDTIAVSLQVKSTKSSTSIFVLASDQDHYFQEVISEGGDTAWSEYSLQYIIPYDAAGAVWKVYPAMVAGEGPAYFDDIRVEHIRAQADPISKEMFPELELQINELNFRKIVQKRNEAQEIGLLFSSKEDLVDANVQVEGIEYKCQTRLKGDLLDHLNGDRWSFRIILDGNTTWRGMNTFSVHNSQARSHLAEWAMHQIMRSEGIISPKYDFMRFVLNRKPIGVYCYEQHFDNHFLAYNHRVTGPVIRHIDDGYWDNVSGILQDYEWAESSQIALFNKEDDGKEQFLKLYHYGHSQLNDYLNGKKPAAEVFDLDKMARYYALMEIGHGLHAQLITNIRFYIDPVTTLLEPIGFDFYGDHLPDVKEHWQAIGQWENGQNIIERSRDGNTYMRRLFGDYDFYQKYMKYLERYSSDDYIERKLQELKTRLEARNDFVKSDPEYEDYAYNLKQQFRKAKFTRAKIYPMPNVSLKSYRTTDETGVVLQGFHYFPLKVIGFASEMKTVYLEKPILIDAYSPDSPVVSHVLTAEGNPGTILYQTLGLDSIFYHEINNDIVPDVNLPTQRSAYVPISANQNIQTAGTSYTVKTKTWIIDKPYVVKAHESLSISSGTRVEFREPGSLTIFGQVLAIGTANEPIIFFGSKVKGQGILIAGSDQESRFMHCSFTSLGSYGAGVVKLPAVVNLDEANVQFIHCQWNRNNARADLEISNSTYHLTNTRFSNNAGDAIRANFSQGVVDKMVLDQYGGDGFIQQGGRSKIKEFMATNVLGWAARFDLLAKSELNKFTTEGATHAVKVKDNSQVLIVDYKGKAVQTDLEVTGSEKPKTTLIISDAQAPKEIRYRVEPGALLKINGFDQKAK